MLEVVGYILFLIVILLFGAWCMAYGLKLLVRYIVKDVTQNIKKEKKRTKRKNGTWKCKICGKKTKNPLCHLVKIHHYDFIRAKALLKDEGYD